MKFNSIDELLEYTKNIVGKTFGDFDKDNELGDKTTLRDKGILGKIIETGFYGYPNNNESRPDFDNLGVELKVVGFEKQKRGKLVAKERTSLSMINYNKIIYEDYEFSRLISKNKKILFIWYFYEENKKIRDFKIEFYQIYDMSIDEDVFKNDFYIIKSKVEKGLAHKLSEGDTEYLGAATKGSNNKPTKSQPYSENKAKSRCFSLKNSYMRYVFNLNFKNQTTQTIPLEKKYVSVLDYVNDKFKPYFGKTQLGIYEEISNEKPNLNYAISKQISNKLIGKDKELPEKDDLFKKSNYRIKNITLRVKGTVKDRMSFRTLQKEEFEKDWEDSEWKSFFEEVKIIVICYQMPNSKSKNGDRRLKFVKKICFTDEEIESFGKTYNMVKEAIEKEDENLLPKGKNSERLYLEVMPHHGAGRTYEYFFEKDKIVSFAFKTAFLNKKIYEDYENNADNIIRKGD